MQRLCNYQSWYSQLQSHTMSWFTQASLTWTKIPWYFWTGSSFITFPMFDTSCICNLKLTCLESLSWLYSNRKQICFHETCTIATLVVRLHYSAPWWLCLVKAITNLCNCSYNLKQNRGGCVCLVFILFICKMPLIICNYSVSLLLYDLFASAM